jgi:hypothetical protein
MDIDPFLRFPAGRFDEARIASRAKAQSKARQCYLLLRLRKAVVQGEPARVR